jgi:hypothetical protein
MVHDKKGWWWRCYTEGCVVRYYEPERMLVELRGTGETISYEELWRFLGEVKGTVRLRVCPCFRLSGYDVFFGACREQVLGRIAYYK